MHRRHDEVVPEKRRKTNGYMHAIIAMTACTSTSLTILSILFVYILFLFFSFPLIASSFFTHFVLLYGSGTIWVGRNYIYIIYVILLLFP